MDSQTAILTPAELTNFADFLDESIKRLRGKGRKMREAVNAARAVWKDEKYDSFQKQLNTCAEDLDKFNNTGMKYAEFLRDKANLANKYLHRR
jgi:uncharacterized protein YukE